MRIVGFGLVAALGVACGGNIDGDPGEPIEGLASIEVTPGDARLSIDGTAAASQSFQATGVFANGKRQDITDRVTWELSEDELGAMDGPLFTSRTTFGGRALVLARAGSVTGQAFVTVTLTRDEPVTSGVGGKDNPDPPAPPDNAAELFDGPESTDPARKPLVVYPNSGVLLPPNLGELELHYEPGDGNTVFAIIFQNDVTDLTFYLRCGPQLDGGCIYQPDLQVWQWLAETNRGEGPVTMTVRATDDEGTEVSTSDPITLEFSLDDLRGAVYYWSTSRRAILRWDFASTTQTEAELFFGDGAGTDLCVGCHALSRDGRSITIQEAGQDSGDQFLVDVSSRSVKVPFPAPEPAVFTSWHPDGDRYVGVYDDGAEANAVDDGAYAGDGDDDQLIVADGETGQRLSVIQAGGTDENPINHPDWSADGKRIAFVSVGNDTRSLQKFHQGRVGFVENSGGSWGSPVWLTESTAGVNRYYPAFAPDSEFLVYNESTCQAGDPTSNQCNADTDPTATLMFARAEAGAASVPGARANAGGVRDGSDTELTNTFPKWSPFEFRRTNGEFGTRLMWVTFSSTRRYGLRQPPVPPNTNESDDGTLIWMAAVDPDALFAGGDPTFAAFVLPFQDITTSNHIAQWAEEAPEIVE